MPYCTTKSEIEQKLYEQEFGTKKEINKIVSTLFDIITDELKNGNDVQIRHFGTFQSKTILPRRMYNPLIKKEIIVNPIAQVRFKAANLLKILCKEGKEGKEAQL